MLRAYDSVKRCRGGGGDGGGGGGERWRDVYIEDEWGMCDLSRCRRRDEVSQGTPSKQGEALLGSGGASL